MISLTRTRSGKADAGRRSARPSGGLAQRLIGLDRIFVTCDLKRSGGFYRFSDPSLGQNAESELTTPPVWDDIGSRHKPRRRALPPHFPDQNKALRRFLRVDSNDPGSVHRCNLSSLVLLDSRPCSARKGTAGGPVFPNWIVQPFARPARAGGNSM
jgi:hypothetical protein